jgi:hypothetical protein
MFVSAHVALNLDTLRWIFLEHQNQFQSTEGLRNKKCCNEDMNLVCFTGFGQKVDSLEEILAFHYLIQF